MRKPRTTMLPALLLAVAMLAGCGGSTADAVPAEASTAAAADAVSSQEDKINVVTTIFPQYDFVRQIAGDGVALRMLLPPGAESHSFEPTPQDIITIQECDVFIYAGGASDTWIEEILASMDTSQMRVLSLLDMVEAKEEVMVEGMENGHAAEEHNRDEVEYDEHVWTSPQNAMAIVRVLTDELCALDAGGAAAYRQNSEAYVARLEELDAAFAAVVAGGVRKTLVFGDRFPFRYLADAYGLDYFAAFPGCSTQTEPSAATVAFLIDKVRAEGIPAVFHIELSNEKMADTICEETGAKKMLMHSCHNVSRDDMAAGVSYLSLMYNNVDALKEALN